jgi:hypothetical protein
MMRPIKIYLLLCSNKVEWTTSVHRDFDEVIAAWEAARNIPETVGIIHVGLTRPPNAALGSVAATLESCVVLTTSARWVFDEFGTYSEPIDYVQGLGLHIATSGWGNTNANLSEFLLAYRSARESEVCSFGSPWLQHLDEVNPKMAREAWSCGIHDDSTYHSHEASLTWDMRHVLGSVRMDYLMKARDPDNPIHVATASPPWLIETPIDFINATVRCQNALRGGGILLVADLLQMQMDDLLKIPNFGRKSLKDLAISLKAVARNGPLLKQPQIEAFQRIEKPNGVVRFLIEGHNELAINAADKHPSRRTFKLAFEAIKSRLKENQFRILSQRIGLDGEKKTLEEIGEEERITRERVRQIESDAIEIFQADGVWESELAARLADLLRDREDPLPAQSLGIFDPWFADVEYMMPELGFILDRVLGNQFYILEINGCLFLTQISKGEWRAAVRDASLFLEKAAQEKIAKSNVRSHVEEILTNKGSELASELWASVQMMALFAKDEKGIEHLVGVGTSAENLVAVVLATSERPLHYSEIPKRIQDSFGRSIEVRRAHSASRNVGILFGRGTFGSLRHCPLNPEEIDILRQEAEEIILTGSVGRQWTCFELVEKLGELALDFESHINQYIVHYALHGSSVLSNLGRFVWTQAGERPSGTQDRIDITQAILSLLQSEGRPMTRSEIRAGLLRDRGLTGVFQIHQRGSLVKISDKYWGILERDIPLSSDDIRTICAAAANLLEIEQRGIHVTEIKGRLSDLAPEVLRVDDAYGIFSLLTFDSRFKMSTSGYTYLASWEGPRRYSQWDAVAIAIRNAKGGIKASEVAMKATEILGRPVERESVYNAMTTVGAKFNDETGLWVLYDDENEAEIDENRQLYGNE